MGKPGCATARATGEFPVETSAVEQSPQHVVHGLAVPRIVLAVVGGRWRIGRCALWREDAAAPPGRRGRAAQSLLDQVADRGAQIAAGRIGGAAAGRRAVATRTG